MAAILKTIFSNAFSWKKTSLVWLKFLLNLLTSAWWQWANINSFSGLVVNLGRAIISTIAELICRPIYIYARNRIFTYSNDANDLISISVLPWRQQVTDLLEGIDSINLASSCFLNFISVHHFSAEEWVYLIILSINSGHEGLSVVFVSWLVRKRPPCNLNISFFIGTTSGAVRKNI